ncbi:helix-turn-helix domain-containing protein (plasmid) [Arthrobacter sp. TES]|nr:helix-turn-helix domain-containing protein [Arthrobacter sp. TES]
MGPGTEEERGWSQAELARRANVSRTFLIDLESGKATVETSSSWTYSKHWGSSSQSGTARRAMFDGEYPRTRCLHGWDALRTSGAVRLREPGVRLPPRISGAP